MTGRLPDNPTSFSPFKIHARSASPHHLVLSRLSGWLLLDYPLPSGNCVHSAYLLLVARLLGTITLVVQRIHNCSVPSWIFRIVIAVRRPPDFCVTLYDSCLLGDCMGVADPRDRVYPECSNARYATAWNPLSNSPIVLVCPPYL